MINKRNFRQVAMPTVESSVQELELRKDLVTDELETPVIMQKKRILSDREQRAAARNEKAWQQNRNYVPGQEVE